MAARTALPLSLWSCGSLVLSLCLWLLLSPPSPASAETYVTPLAAVNQVAQSLSANANTSQAWGAAELTFDGTSLSFSIQVARLSSAVAHVHIHEGPPSENGAVMVLICREADQATSGGVQCPATSSDGVFEFSVSDNQNLSFWFQSGYNATTFAANVAAGNAYWNIHTFQYLDGEARGDIQVDYFRSTSLAAEPSVDNPSVSGTAAITYLAINNSLGYSIQASYLTSDLVQAHLHDIETGEILVNLCISYPTPVAGVPTCPSVTSNGTTTSYDIAVLGMPFSSALANQAQSRTVLAKLANNSAYIRLHTREHLDGEATGDLLTVLPATTLALFLPAQVGSAPTPTDPGNGGSSNTGAIVGGIVGGLAGLLIIGAIIAFFLIRRKREREGHLPLKANNNGGGMLPAGKRVGGPRTSNNGPPSGNIGVQNFTFDELRRATDDFDPKNCLGTGGFGSVYVGVLAGQRVAIKQQVMRDVNQNDKEFMSEVEVLSRIRHVNIINLIGACSEGNNRILVYELAPNGSVAQWLHNSEGAVLSWEQRISVALGVARALDYLHTMVRPPIVHRDLKPSNVLLDADMTPKVADLGLARSISTTTRLQVTTQVMGTFGYTAPEYSETGQLTSTSDIYSFGVVLMELLTGRVPIDMSRAPGQERLIPWVQAAAAGGANSMAATADSALGGSYPAEAYTNIVLLALRCVTRTPSERPTASELVRAFEAHKPAGQGADNNSANLGEVAVNVSLAQQHV